MLAVPPAFLEQLHRQAGATVGLTIDHGCLVIHPKPRPRYTLAELLAARQARKVDTLPAPIMDEVLAKVVTLFE